MNRLLLLRLPLLLLAAHAGVALAQYKCTAAGGAVTFQQTPCVGAKSEQKLSVIPSGRPAPASGVAAPAPSGSANINKRELPAYERQHQRERDEMAQAVKSAKAEKSRHADQRLADIAAARKQYGNDPASARSLREALESIDRRYNALGELDDSRIQEARGALIRGDKAPER